MLRNRCVTIFLAVALLALASGPALAGYPHQNVTLITHSSPGGGTDLFLRQAIPILGPIMGVTFVVENVRGSGGAKAIAALLKSKPDGATFYGATPTFLMTALMGKADYTYQSVEPVVNVFFDPMVAYVKTDSPFKTLGDAIDYAKANPTKATWGTGNPGSLEQQIVLRLKHITGLADVAAVSFEGGGDLMMNVMGGRLDFGIGEPGEILSQVEAGKLRIIGVFTDDRLKNFPDVPTAKELGYDVVITKFRGIVGPPGLPKEVIAAWEEAIPMLLESPEYKAIYEKENLVPGFMKHDAYKAYIEMRTKNIEAFFKEIGLTQ